MNFTPKTAIKLATVALATTLMAGATAYADSVDVNTVESGVTAPSTPATVTPSAPSTDSVTTGNTTPVTPTAPSVDTVGSSMFQRIMEQIMLVRQHLLHQHLQHQLSQ